MPASGLPPACLRPFLAIATQSPRKEEILDLPQRGKAATKNLFLAEPTENAEQKFIFFNIFFHLFLLAL
jgi:hypothetical protein